MAKGNKGRGNRYELECRKLFRELGFEECETSRYASRKLDDAKVDLTDTGPFNVQCKHYSTPLYYYTELLLMPDDEKYNVIFHKHKGRKQYVVITEWDWHEIQAMLNINCLPVPNVEWSDEQRRYNYQVKGIPYYTVVSHHHKKSDCNFSIMNACDFIEILEMLIKNKVI